MFLLLFSLLFLSPLLFLLTEETNQPFVKLNEYTAYAQTYEFIHQDQPFVSNVYFSLPYAQPPVGELRLEKPVALPSDPTRIVNNTDLPPGCHQQEDMKDLAPDLASQYPTSEDCLFLNVLTPSKPPPEGEKYPVLLWIHGGGFVYGMNRFYGWQQLARFFNPRDVVVVIIQYRLAFWGYFSLGTTAQEAGNYGLWDQTAALKFVHDNIGSFGGDESRVTVFGNSAGSVSTHALSLSPHSNIHFKQTIQSSGSMYNLWSHSLGTIESSKKLAKQLKCDMPNVDQIKDCLKKVSVEDTWKVLKTWGRMRSEMDLLYWGPVLDEHFFANKTISQLTEQTPIRDTIYGCTKGEALVFTLNTGAVIASVFAYKLGYTVSTQTDVNETVFKDHVTNYLANKHAAGKNMEQIQDLIWKYYSQNGTTIPQNKFWYIRLTDAQTDGEFNAGQIVEMGEKMNLGWKQHVYLWEYVHPSHQSRLGIDPSYMPHAYEYQYLMDAQPYFSFNKSETNAVEKSFSEKIVNAFANFVKSGDPNTKEVPWPAVDDPVHVKYLRLGDEVKWNNTYFVEKAKLWKYVYALGYGHGVGE